MLNSRYFITTPIFYVNAKPHIGHVYSVLLADAQQRFQQLKRNPKQSILFSVGTDEHGLKIQQASKNNGFSNPRQFCDQVSSTFQHAFDHFNVESRVFVRTTEDRHYKSVQNFWHTLEQNGFLSKKKYQSWYCTQDESFLTEHQIDKEKLISLESGHPVEWAEEENYVFPLEEFRSRLKTWLNGNVIEPNHYKKSLKLFLDAPMPDLSVSRSSERLQWGIPVPNDPSQTIYVWLDALVNYLTVCHYPDLTHWPPNVQVIGKDILKFHAIYWPAFLMAAGLDLPEKIICHGHWTINDEKMSKSKGNVIDPIELSETLVTFEGLRYYLLRHGVPHSDTNFCQEQLINCLNNELANILGNILNRLTSKNVNLKQSFGAPTLNLNTVEAENVEKSLQDLLDKVEVNFEQFQYYQGINEVMDCLRQVNLLVQSEKPWELKKKGDIQRLESVLYLSLNALRIAGILLQPIVPKICDTLLSKLNVQDRTFQKAFLDLEAYKNHPLMPEKVVIFKKI